MRERRRRREGKRKRKIEGRRKRGRKGEKEGRGEKEREKEKERGMEREIEDGQSGVVSDDCTRTTILILIVHYKISVNEGISDRGQVKMTPQD